MIDEAAGYQYERHQNELQVILKELVSDEILEYQKRFPLSLYKEFFRLWGIDFIEKNIRKKPPFIGHLTNKYIYLNLPKGHFVLKELKEKTRKNNKPIYRLHQALTEDKGVEVLKKVIHTIEALASVSENKKEFEKLVKKKFNKDKQTKLPFI